jgi:LuxR family transcriptional regulator, quorum-sensing system regulator BjaR1
LANKKNGVAIVANSPAGLGGGCQRTGMRNVVTKFGSDVLDFIVDLERIMTVEAAVDALSTMFNSFGFETLLLTGLPNPAQRVEQLVLAKRLPQEWFKLYTANQYFLVDPVARLCRRSVQPFEWSEATYDPENEPRAAEVMQRAVDFRMSQGFLIPIHGLTGYEACVSLGGEHLDLNIRSKAAAHLIAIYGFNRIRQLIGPMTSSPRLSRREREVLTWSSQGKSAWEIGEILNISQRTVEEHGAHACEKLGAMNRTHAVAIALRDRIIDP